MSDSSSEEEDLSRFREAVDNSFVNKFNKVNTEKPKAKSERYLEESSHYNDVKYPVDLQEKIAKKISKLIESKVEFVDEPMKVKKRKIKGGVKLFKDSEDFLTCEDAVDTYTDGHNKMASKMKSNKKKILEDSNITEDEKIQCVAVQPEDILSKKGTEHWKSRRKEKLFKYKKTKSNVLLAVE